MSVVSKVRGGYVDTTGTVVQPGGFMSAANMNLNVQTLNQIGGALQVLNGDGTVNQAGTQQLIATLQQQLGANFSQTSLSDNLHTSFTAQGGFGFSDIVEMAFVVALSIMTAGGTAAAMGTSLAKLTVGEAIIVAAASATTGNLASQAIAGNGFSFASLLEAVAVAAVTAGITNGITYNSTTGSFGFANLNQGLNSLPQNVHTLAQLAGISNVASSIVPKAGESAASSLPQALEAIGAVSAIDAGVQTAIEGGSFLRNLEKDAAGNLAAAGAFAIGNAKNGLMTDLGEVGGQLAYVGLHATLGCAASAAEGTGCSGGAIGGAASAAFSPDFLKVIDPTGAALDPGQQAALAGFATLLGGSLAGLAGANPQGGAMAGQNEALNNDGGSADHTADAVKNGGFGSAVVAGLYSLIPWLPGNPVTQAIGSTMQGVMGQIQSHYGRQNPPSGPNRQFDPSGDDSNNRPTASAPVTSALMALCAELGGVGCPALQLFGVATTSPVTSSAASLSSGNSESGPRAGGNTPNGSSAVGTASVPEGYPINAVIFRHIGANRLPA